MRTWITRSVGALALVALLAGCALSDWDGRVLVKIKHPAVREFKHSAIVTGDMVAHNYGSRTRTATCKVRLLIRMWGGAVIKREVPIVVTVAPDQTVRQHLKRRISWVGRTDTVNDDPKLVC